MIRIQIFDNMDQVSEEAIAELLPLVSDERREQALRYKHLFGQFAEVQSFWDVSACQPNCVFIHAPFLGVVPACEIELGTEPFLNLLMAGEFSFLHSLDYKKLSLSQVSFRYGGTAHPRNA